jgi:hypothetical protein
MTGWSLMHNVSGDSVSSKLAFGIGIQVGRATSSQSPYGLTGTCHPKGCQGKDVFLGGL